MLLTGLRSAMLLGYMDFTVYSGIPRELLLLRPVLFEASRARQMLIVQVVYMSDSHHLNR